MLEAFGIFGPEKSLLNIMGENYNKGSLIRMTPEVIIFEQNELLYTHGQRRIKRRMKAVLHFRIILPICYAKNFKRFLLPLLPSL